LTLAFEIVARDIQPPAVAAACCADLAGAAGWEGMVAGQVADLEAENATSMTLEQLEAIHRRKTGRLLTCGLTLGARIAQADATTLDRLTQYGQRLGLAFQITDDLLDVKGDAQTMGKGVRKDAVHGKQTYPALLGVEQSLQKAKDLIDEACQWIAPLGSRAEPLQALGAFVLERDH